MIGTVVKIGLWLAALGAVYNIAQSPAVSNALMLFFTIGAVPGTHIILTPHQTFIWLGVVFVVTLLLIFGTNIYRGLTWLFGYRRRAAMRAELAAFEQATTVQPAVVSSPAQIVPAFAVAPLVIAPATSAVKVKAAKPKPVIIIKIPRKAGPFTKAFRAVRYAAYGVLARSGCSGIRAARTVGRYAAVAGVWVLGGVMYGVRAARTAIIWLGRAIARAALTVSRAAVRAYWFTLRHAGNGAERAVDIAAVVTRIVWAILEPLLRAFDGWLETRLNQNDIFKGVLATYNDARRLCTGWRTQFRARMGLTPED